MSKDFRALLVSTASAALAGSQLLVAIIIFVAQDVLASNEAAPILGGTVLALTAAVAMGVARRAGRTVATCSDVVSLLRTAEATRFVSYTATFGLAILVSPGGGPLILGVVTVGLVAATAAGQLYQPARSALARELLLDDQLDRGSSLQQTFTTGGQLVGTALGAPVVAMVGLQGSLLLASAGSAISWAAISLTQAGHRLSPSRRPPRSADPAEVGHDMGRPVREIPEVRAVVSGAFFITLGVGAASSLDPYFLGSQLRVSITYLSALGVALSAGLILGGLAFPKVSVRLGRAGALYASVATAGVAFLAYALSQSIWWAIGMLFLYALAGGVAEASVAPLLWGALSPREIPMAFSIIAPVVQFGSLASLIFFGVAAGLIDPTWRWQIGPWLLAREGALMLLSSLGILLGAISLHRTLRISRTHPRAAAQESPATPHRP